MNFSDFLLVELTRVNQAFYLSVALGDRSVFLSTTHVYPAPLKCFDALSDKRCHSSKSLFAPLSRYAVLPFRLLLGSKYVYRRQPRPFRQQRLVGGKPLCRPHALPYNLGYCMELSCHNIFMHLGRSAP